MATKMKHKFEPDYIVPPGDTLKEALDERGMSQLELAGRMGMAEKTISQIINGIAPITVDTADKLELVLGIAASFWNRRELAYQEAKTREGETEKFAADAPWLAELPMQELIKRKAIEPARDKAIMVRRALQFFGVSSVDAWRKLLAGRAIQFRGKEVSERKPGHVAAWRRLGVLQAASVETQPFNAQEFDAVLKAIRRDWVSRPPIEWWGVLGSLCAPAGVAVVFTREIPGAAVSGLARWLGPEKAMIQLSLKYKTEDHVWFTFFHEAGHILLHRAKKAVFMDCGYSDEGSEEREANSFARDRLIPPEFARRLHTLKKRAHVLQFAKDARVSAGVVVGRLEHDGHISPGVFANLKKKIDWKDE